ncbi:tetratricopeptide repeat protein [uncultured Microscilla sp.]|uniref:tetratricopeptide repeat protein n=1 Tax=uncultured Microscilla sp. TaxID=432653 RepID=UPI00261618CE|nr:tetratricopeptide repeat protein [uncultured Microscilla sp.]
MYYLLHKLPGLVLWLLLLSTYTFAQNHTKTDSLKHRLHSVPDTKEKLQVYNALAREYSDQLDSTQTLLYANLALNLAKQTNSPQAALKAHSQIGWLLLFTGYYAKAKARAHHMLTIVQKHPHLKNHSNVYNLLGAIEEHQGNYKPALVAYKQALQIAQQTKDTKGIGVYCGNIGNVYESLGNIQQTLHYHQKALKFAQASGNQKGISANYNNLALTFQTLGDYPKALTYYQKSLRIKEKLKLLPGIAKTLHNIGSLYEDQHNYPEAITYFHKSLKTEQQLNDRRGVAQSYSAIGGIYDKQQQYDKALVYYQKSLKLSTQIGNKSIVAHSKLLLGNLMITQKEYTQAFNYLRQALELYQKLGEQPLIAEVFLHLAKALYHQQKYPQALAKANKGVTLAQQTKQSQLLKAGAEIRAKIHKMMGNYQDAYQDYHLFKQMTDSLLNIGNAQKIAHLKTKYTYEKKQDSLHWAHAQEKSLFIEITNHRRTVQNTTYALLVLSLLLLLVVIRFYRSKQKNNQQLNALNQALNTAHEHLKKQTRARLQEAQARANAETKNLQNEINYKNQQVTTHTLHMLQKNQTLRQLRTLINEMRQQKNFSKAKKMCQKLVNLIDQGLNMDKDWESFHQVFDQLHPDFYQKLKHQYPSLTKNDLQVCALLRLNLNTKDISDLMGIAPDSVKMQRYRLRKKLEIASDQDLNEFMIMFDPTITVTHAA